MKEQVIKVMGAHCQGHFTALKVTKVTEMCARSSILVFWTSGQKVVKRKHVVEKKQNRLLIGSGQFHPVNTGLLKEGLGNT